MSLYEPNHYETAQTQGNVAEFLARRMYARDTFSELDYKEAVALLTSSIETQRRSRAEHSYFGNNFIGLAELRIFGNELEKVPALIA